MIQFSQAHRVESLHLQKTPKRVLSLVPSMTETLFEFDVEPVGRTSFCIEPSAKVGSVPVVGGTKSPSVGKIFALKPDLVIANLEENRKEDIDCLEEHCNVWVSFPCTLNETLQMLCEMTQLSPKETQARLLVQACEKSLQQKGTVGSVVSFAVAIWKNPWMFAGKNTYISNLISSCGGSNVVMQERYPEIDIETLQFRMPDIVFLPSEPYAFDVEDQRQLSDLLQVSKDRIVLIGGEDLTWPGLRLIQARKAIKEIFSRISETI
ncbi:MAG: ABC transporter substrate-binding protein [Bdellovibrionales bacterium]|nr:ABC transporter substrate-binding protein [Bdellovibrionales bacterium]